jgi:hypothetical protein
MGTFFTPILEQRILLHRHRLEIIFDSVNLRALPLEDAQEVQLSDQTQEEC